MVWDNTKDHYHTHLLFNLHCIGTALSLIGSLWAIYFCLRSRGFKKIHLRFVFAIILSDFFYAISNLLAIFDGPKPKVNTICASDAFIRVWSFTLILYFATCLTILCFKRVKYGADFNQGLYFRRCVIIGVIFCIWLTAGPAFLPKTRYANGDLCCDIIVEDPANAFEFIVTIMHGAIPIIAMLGISLIAYIATIIVFRGYPPALVKENKNIYKLFWYPAVLFIIFGPGLTDIYTINFFAETDENYFWLEVVHLLMTRCSGILNAFVFGVQMRNHYYSQKEIRQIRSENYRQEEAVSSEIDLSRDRLNSLSTEVRAALLA